MALLIRLLTTLCTAIIKRVRIYSNDSKELPLESTCEIEKIVRLDIGA